MPQLLFVYEPAANQPHHLISFHCPGCNREHPYRVANPGATPEQIRAAGLPCWTWNGSHESPTFEPSLLCEPDMPQYRCHLFLTNGKIRFLDDCHHALRGQTVDMVPFDP